jgi:hypothetical protein
MRLNERLISLSTKWGKIQSVFSMLKAKLGERLRSKTERAQVNEALCKVLSHNICCLIQCIHELGIEANFWPVAARVTRGVLSQEIWFSTAFE